MTGRHNLAGLSNIFAGVLEHSVGRASRSNVVRPLLYVIAALIVALLVAISLEAYVAIQIALMLTLLAALAFFAWMFVRFANKDPDALRSETFAIQKQLIDRGLVGDATSGLRTVNDLGTQAEGIETNKIEPKKIESK